MITIRRETPEDIAAVQTVVTAAFERPDEANGVDLIRKKGGATLSLVAEIDGVIVGHILFSPVTIEGEQDKRDGLGLAPLAVSPEFQNKGVGSALVREGLDQCRALGFGYVILLGHPTYYPRFGFRTASSFGLGNTFGAPDEAFMALELVDGALAGRTGVVRFQPEWDGV